MDPRIGSLWLIAICVGIVMISCCISGVACDVPDDVVYTDLHKTVRIGDSVVLKCQFRGTPLAVYWKKGGDPERSPTLVSWITGDPATGVCVGERVCQIMEMNAEFSLIIKEVSIVEQGRYVCRVSNYKGLQIHNFTDISVFSPPKEPYPIINECQIISPNNTETTCTISTSQSLQIGCSASGYFPDIDLYFLHGSTSLQTKDATEVTNLGGTKNKTIYAIATASEISYVCFASIPGLQEQRISTVLVNLPETPSSMPAGPTIPIDKTDGSVAKVVVPVIVIAAVICFSIILWRRRKQQTGQGTYAKVLYHPPLGNIDGIISYFELEKLVEEFDNGSLNLIAAELIEDSKGELESERTKADLYKSLCEWKESSSGSAFLLYSAMEKNNLEYEDFLASIDNAVSDDDLEHICWHVHSCRETVQPIVDLLQYSSTSHTKPTDNDHISAPSRYDEIRDDLQIMKRWKVMSAATKYRDKDEHCDETVKFRAKSEEIGFKSKHTESMPSNQMIQLCRALEKAGRTTGDSDGHVYHQLSKTFYKIPEEYKSELTDEVLKGFALNITKRHCQRLGDTIELSRSVIANRNEEDLEMFGTDNMLKTWVLDQKCSNYEIRRRLRQAAERCNRQDIADNFISKEQSEVMTSPMKLPACVTITNEEQSTGAIRSESNKLDSGTSVPPISHGDFEETRTSVAQPAANTAESEVGFVRSISRDEINRIKRNAGSPILRAFLSVVQEQPSPEGKKLLVETKAINGPTPTLDSKHDRRILKQLLENEQPRYACLLAMKKPFNIFDVELIDVAFRLIMADVYPFAKALNISDRELTPYRRSLGPHNLTQGTANIMKQVNTDNRVLKVKALEKAAYSEEARALYFGFEISIGDVIEVQERVDKAQLAKQLGVSDDVQSTEPDNLHVGKDTLHQSVLVRWRDTVRSSTFNHRLVLADALFRMGEEQLALDIISGVYRHRGINKPVSKLLADTIPEGQLPTLCQVLNQKAKIGQNCQDVISAWVDENTYSSSPWKKQLSLSNRLLAAGFYAFAHEIMAGAWREDKKARQKEGTKTRNVASEELCQEGIAINKKGVMQEKNGEGAAESKESTTENVETKEQGKINTLDGSDECQQDESSKLLIQVRT